MANWTVKQVTNWLKENGFRKQVKIFKEKNIDGNTLLKLTDYDISQLFVEINQDGIIQEATIGAKSRFRTILLELKMNNNHDENTDDSSRIVPVNTIESKIEPEHVDNQNKLKENKSDHIIREATYLIDKEIEIQFFNNKKFLSYFIDYVKQETFSIEIEIKKIDLNDNDELSNNYTIKLIGTKQQNHIVKNFIKNLLESIKSKIYNQKNTKNWIYKLKPIEIIQNIFDKNEIQLFTVCQLNYNTLEIYYFENEKFNPPDYLIKIEDIIQNQISQEKILWKSHNCRDMIKFIPFNTHEILWTYQICKTEQFSNEFEEILNQYKQDDSLISITMINPRNYTEIKYRSIEIFGNKILINEVLQKFQHLFDKHRLRKFRFSHLTSTEFDCLVNLCPNELNNIGSHFRHNGVRVYIEKNEFYGPQCLKNTIRNHLKNLFENLKTKTFTNIDFYFTLADNICLNIKNLAKRNHCYCEINQNIKLKSYPIPKGYGDTSNTSKFIIEQSNLFCSSPLVFRQMKLNNSSIDVLIGDIAAQKVNILIIPSIFSGLKESLIERAGEIIEKPSSSSSKNNSIPFITETTGGKLNCEKILFVNWSLPTRIINDDDLSESIRFFISKSIEYVVKDSQLSNLKSQSIAFAISDLCKQEDIFVEEIIEETINQINSIEFLSFQILFVLLPDQQTLHQRFLNTIEKLQQKENYFGSFYCSTSTVSISLKSFDDEYLTKCENKINNYLQRSIFKTKLDHFQHWNQYLINSFYKYAIDRCVLPKINNQQQIVLYGHVSNVYEVNQKYQLTNALIQQKLNSSSINYNIMLSYSKEDSIICHRLANRLIDEGFSVSINSNEINQFENLSKKLIKKSDCIILCISRNYFQNEYCKNEAQYSQHIGKYIIPIKIEYYQPIEWLKDLIEKESYFQLYGSENQFNLEYEKILLKIFQYTKPGSVSSFGQTSHILPQNNIRLFFLLTPEQKKLKYEKNMKKLMKFEKGKINEDDKQNLFDQIQNILQLKENQCHTWVSKYRSSDSPFDQDCQKRQEKFAQIIRFAIGIISYRQWLDKLQNLKSILNIAPFTFTGDINDARFPLLNEVLQNSNLLYYLRTHYSMKIESDSSSSKKNNYRSRKSQEQINPLMTEHAYMGPNQPSIDVSPLQMVNLNENLTTKMIDSKRTSITSRISNHSVKSVKDINRDEKKPRRIIQKKPLVRSSFTKSEKLEFQFKFTEQMQKNIDEFQKFCDDQEHLSSSTVQQKIQAYPTAIFGSNPFSNIPIEPRKQLPIYNRKELPLKFPWNGVFDTEIPTVKRKDPSIFFFFEATSSEKH